MYYSIPTPVDSFLYIDMESLTAIGDFVLFSAILQRCTYI